MISVHGTVCSSASPIAMSSTAACAMLETAPPNVQKQLLRL